MLRLLMRECKMFIPWIDDVSPNYKKHWRMSGVSNTVFNAKTYSVSGTDLIKQRFKGGPKASIAGEGVKF